MPVVVAGVVGVRPCPGRLRPLRVRAPAVPDILVRYTHRDLLVPPQPVPNPTALA